MMGCVVSRIKRIIDGLATVAPPRFSNIFLHTLVVVFSRSRNEQSTDNNRY
jgi:hypothetical protein